MKHVSIVWILFLTNSFWFKTIINNNFDYLINRFEIDLKRQSQSKHFFEINKKKWIFKFKKNLLFKKNSNHQSNCHFKNLCSIFIYQKSNHQEIYWATLIQIVVKKKTHRKKMTKKNLRKKLKRQSNKWKFKLFIMYFINTIVKNFSIYQTH